MPDEQIVTDGSPVIESEKTEQIPAEDTEDPKKPLIVEPKVEVEEEPVIRHSVREHILARKLKKAVKETHEEVSDEEEITPAGRKAIQSEVAPLIDLVRKQSDDAELAQVFSKYPDARAMEKSIRKHMDAYPNTPAQFIYEGLAAKALFNKQAKMKADEEAGLQRTGGGNHRPKEEPKEKSAWDMSEDEFKKSVDKLMTTSQS